MKDRGEASGPRLVDETEALDSLGTVWAAERTGPLGGTPFLAVRLGDTERAAAIAGLARAVPCVIVGVARHADDLPPPDLDVLLCDEPDPPPPWVGCGETPTADVSELAAAVARSPQAAVVLVQLLRLSQSLDIAAALVLESLAYATLQGGAEHQRWLAAHEPRRPAGSGTPLIVERAGGQLRIRFNRPHVHNAFDTATRDALFEALSVAVVDDTVTDIEISGAGPSFCSGGDLSEFGTTPDAITGHLVRSTRNPATLLAIVGDRTTALVHGACVGAGVEFAAFAHQVKASSDAWFALPEIAMGLIPGAGGTASITRRIGRQRTAFLALTGSRLKARTALRWGLVDGALD